ncbi:thioesterase domain-containing protein [Streptomyces klenkii]|uniref:thioesterase domain-containing protein n=1 Tax=Streptomyces klenkii TaxID=1420899 RepID=UPI0033AABEF5
MELDEIRLAIEAHDWVKNAAVLVKDNARTGFEDLIAYVELSPKEAALMDQGNGGAHHQTKQNKLQVKAQLSNNGVRSGAELAGRPSVQLPGAEPTRRQRRQVFARKTYRFFDGGETTRDDLRQLLRRRPAQAPLSRPLQDLSLGDLGELLRYFGQFHSPERLLPKYGYASPGSLYATQMYLELSGIAQLPDGHYYYHPVEHRLIRIRETSPAGYPRFMVHFLGRKGAIEPVYKNNIQEVLALEAGHMLGLFDEVLPAYGLGTGDLQWTPQVREAWECGAQDYYLGSAEIVPASLGRPGGELDVYVQAHPGKARDLPAGQYRCQADGSLEPLCEDLVRKKDVIAINQRVYERSGFGVTLVARPERGWLAYTDLGRALQRYQMNDLGLGLMSSGYSSETGHDLPAARRVTSLLQAHGERCGPCYFAVGGKVSAEQIRSEDMREDIVHMQGPAEMIREDLAGFLPDYMVPNNVIVMDQLPHTANGKIDLNALRAVDHTSADTTGQPFVPPRTRTEKRVGAIWARLMKRDAVSVHDDFFASGGNSLTAVSLINQINKTSGSTLPLQALFESPTIEALARRLDGTGQRHETGSRLVRLRAQGADDPVFCWPGLGGYPMNLRLLAERLETDRPFYGIQAHGINAGETPFTTIAEMAAADLELIRQTQPHGPYTLWGYSFGARVAFEAAHQLEQAGEEVENLFLIAPGAPRVRAHDAVRHGHEPSYRNPAFVTILFSVFAGSITSPLLNKCLTQASDDETFTDFIVASFDGLAPELVRRIVRIVRQTYEFTYTFHELAQRRIAAPITVFKAQGDDYSFIENSDAFSTQPPTMVTLQADHYSLLRDGGVDELLQTMRHLLRLDTGNTEVPVPQVNIKHFPVPLSEARERELIAAVTEAVRSAFECGEDAISIALEPIPQEAWDERVRAPELIERGHLLVKTPTY